MKKLFWLVILPMFFINCGEKFNVNVVSFMGMWGVALDNKVQFYVYEDEVWQIKPDFELSLPKRYKNIFTTEDYDSMIGVIFNDKVQFYRYSEENYWQIIPEYELKLPSFNKNIFGSRFFYDYTFATNQIEIGIILKNKVQFYQYKNNWEIFPDSEFIIPNEYKNISSGLFIYFNTFDYYDEYGFIDYDYDENEFYYIGSTMGLVSENKVQFFGLGIYPGEDENNMEYIWKVIPELEFILPKGYKNIFVPDTIGVFIGIVFNNNVQFYTFDNKKGWITIEYIDFKF